MDDFEYAGFWIRVGAALIDTLIIFIVIMMPLSYIYGPNYWSGNLYVYGFWDIILGWLVPIVGTIWFWLHFFGTPGKMATNLKIVDSKTGSKLTLKQAILRYIAYIPAMLPFFLGFIWIGVDPKKQGLHDKLASTVVIKSTSKIPVTFEQDV